MAGSGAKRRCQPQARDAATSGDAHLFDGGLLRAENPERGGVKPRPLDRMASLSAPQRGGSACRKT